MSVRESDTCFNCRWRSRKGRCQYARSPHYSSLVPFEQRGEAVIVRDWCKYHQLAEFRYLPEDPDAGVH